MGGPATWPPRSAFGSTRLGRRLGDLFVLELTPSLCWIILKGCDLGLELLVKHQFLLLLKDIFAIEGHLLLLTIRLLLLFLYLISHLVGHLKELVFMLLRWLDAGNWFLWRRRVGVLSDMWSVVSIQGIMSPVVLAALLQVMAAL